jgi:hypothetical protein
MTIILLPLVLVGALLAWAAGARPRLVLGGAAVAAVLVLVSAVVLGIAMSESEDEEDLGSLSRPVDESIAVAATHDEFAPPVRPISGLDDDPTRLIEVTGLPADRTAHALQCVAEAAQCEPSLPVRADGDGRAVLLFEFTPCTAAQCTFVVTDDRGERLVSSPLVFGRSVGEGTVSLDRDRELRPGDTIVVSLTGFEAGPVTVTYCTPPGPIEPDRCGSPAPEVGAVVGRDGRGSVALPVHVGPVGRNRAECGRGHPCAVAVAGRPDVAATRLAFAGSADAQPSSAQVALGIAAAALLLGLAYWLSRRGRWEPPDGDPFAGVTLDDPFKDLDLDVDPDEPQPATSRRTNDAAPTAVRIAT